MLVASEGSGRMGGKSLSASSLHHAMLLPKPSQAAVTDIRRQERMQGSAIALLRHMVGAAFVDLVGQRHGDAKGRGQDGCRHNRDGDQSACHHAPFTDKVVGRGGQTHHPLRQHAALGELWRTVPKMERFDISPCRPAVALKARNEMTATSG
jgi:hypothetical protein